MEEFYSLADETGFTQVSNKHIIRNRELTLQERSILNIMLSHSATWKLSLKNIAYDGCISKNTAAKYINNLIKKGYVYRIRKRDNKGRLSNSIYYFSWNKERLKQKIDSLKNSQLNFLDNSSTKNCELDNSPNTKNCELENDSDNQHITPNTKNCELDKESDNEVVNPSNKNCEQDKQSDTQEDKPIPPSHKNWDTLKDNNKNKKDNKIQGSSFSYWISHLLKMNFNDVPNNIKNDGYKLLLEMGFNDDMAIKLIKSHDLKDKHFRAFQHLLHCDFTENEAIKYINHTDIVTEVFKWKHKHSGKNGSFSWNDGEKSYLKGGFKKKLRLEGVTDHNDNII